MVVAASTVPISISLAEEQSGETPPEPPTGLGATGSASSVALLWSDASDNESLFALERSLASGDYSAGTVFEVAANVAEYTDSAVVDGTTYFYRIEARNDVGDSA